ncbi:MAG: hypothetical protein R3C05_03070 [Pirellulaceae bacterium]
MESFCRSQGLPWDEAYSTWLQTADDARHGTTRNGRESIRPYVCGPTPLAWGKSFRQTVLANQQSPQAVLTTCDVTRDSSEQSGEPEWRLRANIEINGSWPPGYRNRSDRLPR